MVRGGTAAAVCVLAIATAACCLLVLYHRRSGASALLGPCSDSTICSRYALLRSAGGQLQHTGPHSRATLSEESRVDVVTGGFSFQGLGAGLVTAPVAAAADLVQREAQSTQAAPASPSAASKQTLPDSREPAASATGGFSLSESQLGLPRFSVGQVLHISTSQGRLPLFVDGAMDAKGDVPVHGFREGLRYEGYIRVGDKARGISYPPSSSILHAMYKIPREERETSVRGSVKLHNTEETVTGQLAIAPDNGVMTTINTRAMATPDGALAFNPNFVYGSPAAPLSRAFAPLRAISQRVQQQRRQREAAALRRRRAQAGAPDSGSSSSSTPHKMATDGAARGSVDENEAIISQKSSMQLFLKSPLHCKHTRTLIFEKL
jgi:hypothetical protein